MSMNKNKTPGSVKHFHKDKFKSEVGPRGMDRIKLDFGGEIIMEEMFAGAGESDIEPRIRADSIGQFSENSLDGLYYGQQTHASAINVLSVNIASPVKPENDMKDFLSVSPVLP